MRSRNGVDTPTQEDERYHPRHPVEKLRLEARKIILLASIDVTLLGIAYLVFLQLGW
jgi:hypothetical protein